MTGSGIRDFLDPGSVMEKFGSGIWDKYPDPFLLKDLKYKSALYE
jgi:hypothetical protein